MAPRWLGLALTMLRQRHTRAAPCALAALQWALAGCGTDAVGVEACRQIEEARCEQAPACGIALEPPYRTSGTGVTECVRFYDDACLHGLADGHDPGPIAVSACVAAIRSASTTGACAAVASPASASACAWLAPSSAASDASGTSVEAAAAADEVGTAE